jgi:hypothetical protein
MHKRIAFLVVILGLALTTAASAQMAGDVSGRVVRVDPTSQVVILDNNQTFRVTPNTVLLVDNRPVAFGTLQPGQTVVIRSGESVAVSQAAPAPAAGSTVVVAPPAAAPAAPHQTTYGRVTDVDSGEVKIQTDKDKFEVRVPREVAAQVRKGDTVRLDLTFNPSR